MYRSRWLSVFAVAATLALASCGDQAPTGPAAPAPEASLLGNLLQKTGLLTCSPLPYDSVTQTVGYWGGTINVGPHRLYIPPGALDHNVQITAVLSADTVNAVRFEPHGLTFDRPAYLTMSYANCNLLGSLLPKQIVYTDDVYSILQYLLSWDNLWGKKVTGEVHHFSQYAVAW